MNAALLDQAVYVWYLLQVDTCAFCVDEVGRAEVDRRPLGFTHPAAGCSLCGGLCVTRRAVVGAKRGVQRTWNIPLIIVTFEMFHSSGWLNAAADCETRHGPVGEVQLGRGVRGGHVAACCRGRCGGA